MAYKRIKVEIPAAGEKTRVQQTGWAVQIEAAAIYAIPEDVPLLSFDTLPEVKQPIYDKAVYNASPCGDPRAEFGALFIHGTAESSGDTLYLLISDTWAEQDIKPITRRVLVGETQTESLTDTAVFEFPIIHVFDSTKGLYATAVIVTFSADTRVSFVADPVPTSGGHLFSAGDQLYIQGSNFVANMKFIAEVTSSTIHYTMEY